MASRHFSQTKKPNNDEWLGKGSHFCAFFCYAGKERMGKYDVYDKKYFAKPQIMAELITVSVFRKKINVKGEELQGLPVIYPSPRSRGAEFERDVLYLCKRHCVKYGLEIESYVDFSMARRIQSYDTCEYEAEAKRRNKKYEEEKSLKTFEERKSGMKKGDKNIPIVNIVLYLGAGRYSGNRSMRESFYSLPDELKPYLQEKINDYGFVLVEADYIDPEMFQGELRAFFRAMQARTDKQRLLTMLYSREFEALSEDTKKIIAIHLGDKKLTKEVVEEGVDMCKALDDLRKECETIGETKGENKAQRNSIMLILSNKGEVSRQLQQKITDEEDSRKLYNYVLLAASAKSVEEFEKAIGVVV